MTGDEMERGIEFLLQSQASYETRLADYEARLGDIAVRQDRTDAQIAETNRQLQTQAETQSRFIETMTTTITGLAEAQVRTDAKLNRLISLFEQHIVAAH